MKQFIPILLLLGLIPMTVSADASQQQLFFDDFVSSEFPAQWTTSFGNSGNLTQQGGYLIFTLHSSLFQSVGQNNIQILGNQTGPIFTIAGSSNPEFRQITFRMQAINLTNVVAIHSGASEQILAHVRFGLASFPFIAQSATFFDVWWSNDLLSHANNGNTKLPPTKQAIIFNMDGLPTSYVTGSATTGTNPGILYSTSLDVDAIHIFTIQIQLQSDNPTNDYIRWQVDNNAWMRLNQTACNCLDNFWQGYNNNGLYPFIAPGYLITAPGTIPATVSQSMATSIDYVLVTNFVPANLPSGQLLSSNINPPTHNQGIYQSGGFSLTQYIQFEAWQIGQGNIYAGGLFLTGLFLLIITAGLAGAFWKLRLGMSIFGMIWNISTLAFVYLMFFTGVLPLIIPVLVSIGAAAIFFGIFRSGPPANGGEITG